MPRITKKLRKVHSDAITQFDRIQDTVRDQRDQCVEDRRFYSIAGAQWEGDLGKQFKKKPRFEVNKVHLSVIRIINEYRNNRITVDFVSKDGAEAGDLASTCDGLYRADEEDSGAQEAYDNAFEEAVAGGMGAWRLRACYEDEEDPDNDHQRIRIEPIFDADTSVYFDLASQRQDKADANYCFVIYAMPVDDYIEEYNDDPASWPKDTDNTDFDWATPDIVYIAEYYVKEKVKENLQIWQNIDGEEEKFLDSEIEDDPDLLTRLTAKGSQLVRNRSITKTKIHKYILSGNEILEDCGIIAGKCIPIIPVYGKRWYIDNIERCQGHVRLAKDAQRLKNMQLSKLGETSALSTVEKPILTPEQVAGHELMWADDNIENFPYLLINPITDAAGNVQPAGPIAYTKPPQIAPALAALLQITEVDMKELLGNQQAAEEMQPNVSGKAVELIQNKLDMQTYIYMSNMSKAIKRSGEIWLSMASDILVESGRRMKALDKEKAASTVELMQPAIDSDTGEMIYKNDLSNAKFDISVDFGPSTSSKRAATVREVTGMMQISKDPETLSILSAVALMNMEGEGIREINQYYRRKLVLQGVIEPNEEEKKMLAARMQAEAGKGPSPEQQYLQSLAAESTAKADKAKADTIHTVAKAEETKAKTAEILSDIGVKERSQVVDTVKKITEMSRPQAGEKVG